MKRVPYQQADRRWRNVRWYDPKLEKHLRKLTEAIQAHELEPLSRTQLNVREELTRFTKAVDGYLTHSPPAAGQETLGESGCWHTSVANLLRSFNVRIRGQEPTPVRILKEFSAELFHTLTGYSMNPPLDPVTVLTGGTVQLLGYRDFGRRGVTRRDRELAQVLDQACAHGHRVILNVQGHEHHSDDSHYVLLTDRSEADYVIEDPGWPRRTRLWKFYHGVYQICVYQRIKKVTERPDPSSSGRFQRHCR